MKSGWNRLIVAVIACCGMFAPADAAEPRDVISSTGAAIIRRLPDRIRIQSTLAVADADLETALQKLKQAQDKTAQSLEKANVDKETIAFSEPTLSEETAALRPDAAKRSLTSTLQAEWPVDAGTAEELLLNGVRLESEIRAALNGLTDDTFVFYVRTLSAEERVELTGEALSQARKEAKLLAEAAGRPLGPLTRATCIYQSSADPQGYSDAAGDHAPLIRILRDAGLVPADQSLDRGEGVARSPRAISFRATVLAEFTLLKHGANEP